MPFALVENPLGSERLIDSAFRIDPSDAARVIPLRIKACAREADFGSWLRQRDFTMSKIRAADFQFARLAPHSRRGVSPASRSL
jgi:hypothetical protein